MRKVVIMVMLISGLVSNVGALINLGLRGGYAYESLKPKEVHYVIKCTFPDTTITDTTYTPKGEEAETKYPAGFGGELLSEIVFPVIPISIELGAGYYITSYKEIGAGFWGDTTEYTYTINSIKLSALGRYFTPGIPMISPWVGIGPFVALNTHKVKDEELNMTLEGERLTNFGVFAGIGAKISTIPKLFLNVAFLFDYFITSKGKFTWGNITQESTSETKFSQWNINFSVGMTYKIM